jgi:uncharacterized protein YndB with AHSA1/START domain
MEITTEAIIQAPVSTIWKAITNTDEMRLWYFDMNGFRVEEGVVFTFVGQGKEAGTTYVHRCEVKEVIENKKLTYTWTYDNLPGTSYVTFDLDEQGQKTLVRLTHSGVESFSANGSDFQPENFREGWNYIINTSLKNFAEN